MNKSAMHPARFRMVSLFALTTSLVVTATFAALKGRSAAVVARPSTAPQTANEEAARAAFLAAYPVFMHPRCMNCHPQGDAPLQGDDSHVHVQNVKRGIDGKGKYALKCTNCHQPTNLPGENMPPGVPNWHMLPENMKMVFEGRSAGELCRQLKDPAQNGGKSIADLLHHVGEDPLVQWGWEPGDGRTLPPISHAEFVAKMKQWADNGTACPE